MAAVHIAIVREVKAGMEAEFEAALRGFISESMHFPGVQGALLLVPPDLTARPEYGILRSFQSREAADNFYSSDMYADWEQRIAHLVAGKPELRDLHGLEAFFRGSGAVPPRWKMAVITWLGVFPTALLFSRLLPPLLAFWPKLLVSAVVNVFVVAALAWIVMPLLVRMFSPWLRRST